MLARTVNAPGLLMPWSVCTCATPMPLCLPATCCVARAQIRGSHVFKEVLRTALATGNYLNHNTAKGNVIGFRCPRAACSRCVCQGPAYGLRRAPQHQLWGV
jgi:hypothetical protein